MAPSATVTTPTTDATSHDVPSRDANAPATVAREEPRAATPPSEPAPRDSGGSSMPRGWRHSVLVTWLRQQPRERRETILASLFALVAAVWAPLGVLAFLARVFTIFAVVSALVVVAAAAPRPTAVAALTGAIRTRVLPELRVAWRGLARASRHVRRELPGVVAQLRDEASPALQRAGERTAASTSKLWSSIKRGAAHTRERLAELGPHPAQSSPRSAR